MIVKVCGMRQAENIGEVASLGIDLIGFIFYPPSPRYVSDALAMTPKGIGRVGVFVDATFDTIIEMAHHHLLTHIQLHGDEPPELCRRVKNEGYTVTKAIRVASAESFDKCTEYECVVDMFLFDTASAAYGGSGSKFDWSLISTYYTGELPYLLSGGINMYDIESIMKIEDGRLLGVDLNSCFEYAPALKDAKLLKQFIKQLNNFSK